MFLWDPNSATNVRPDVLLHVHCTLMFPGLCLDNHYPYQKDFIRGIRSEAGRWRDCVGVRACVRACVSVSVYVAVYIQVIMKGE